MALKTFKISELAEGKISAMIYAVPKTGKTTVLGELPGKTLIIDVDHGTQVLAKEKEENIDIYRLSADLNDLNTVLTELEKKCDYDNVCLDSISELEKKMLTIMGRLGKNDGTPEQGHYQKVQFKLNDYVRRLRDLPCNLIITAWEDQFEFTAPDGSKYTQSKPRLSGKSVDPICGLLDMIGRLEISTKEDSKGKRYINFTASPVRYAGDRLKKRSFCEIGELL